MIGISIGISIIITISSLTSLCIFLLLLNGDCNISDKNELFCIQSNLQQGDSCKSYTVNQTV